MNDDEFEEIFCFFCGKEAIEPMAEGFGFIHKEDLGERPPDKVICSESLDAYLIYRCGRCKKNDIPIPYNTPTATEDTQDHRTFKETFRPVQEDSDTDGK